MDSYRKQLFKWCAVPAEQLEHHPDLKVPFRLVEDSASMGLLMAEELIAEIEQAQKDGREFRAIVPCGPACWYADWRRLVNERQTSLKHVTIFHMDECLDWEGKELPRKHPYSFRGFMEDEFYAGIPDELNVPEDKRFFLSPASMETVRGEIWRAPIDFTLGGWGQDGHIAYNQTRRMPYTNVTLEMLRESSIHMQYNNDDTILALANRTFGTAYQFVPPMSVTLGVKECLSAKKVRLFSDTGAWKMTALRFALFSEATSEYPMTLLQEHPDAMVTATRETAAHPISLHPEWALG